MPACRYFDSALPLDEDQGREAPDPAADRRCATASRAGPLQWKFSGPLSRKNRMAGRRSPASWPGRGRSTSSPLISRRPGRSCAGSGASPGAAGRASSPRPSPTTTRRSPPPGTPIRACFGAACEMYEYQAAKLHTKLAHRRRRRPHRLGQPRFPEPLHQHGGRAADRRCRIRRRRCASYFERGTEAQRADHARAAPAAAPTSGAGFKWTISYWLVTSMDYTVTRRLNFNER